MSILVTGGSGLIGKYLQQICPDWIYVSSKDFNLISQRDANLLVKQERPDWVIHLAAKVGGILSNQKYPCDYLEENALMGINIVRAARINEIKNFTGVISTCAYPDVHDEYPLKEEHLYLGPPSKSNFGYGIAKRMLAAHIDTCNEQHGTTYNYVIPCNLYGFYADYNTGTSHYVSALIKKIYQAEVSGSHAIELFGTGAPLRQFMYAHDAAMAIKEMVERKITSSFNIATPEVKSIKEIAETALKALNKEDYKIIFNSNMPDGQFRKDASNERFSSLFPGFKFTSLSDGIEKTYNFYKQQQS